jgi:hypothetical protein
VSGAALVTFEDGCDSLEIQVGDAGTRRYRRSEPALLAPARRYRPLTGLLGRADATPSASLLTDELYVAMTRPAPGEEAEFNRWYDTRHSGEIFEHIGFQAGQRFRLEADDADADDFPYLAIWALPEGEEETCRERFGHTHAERAAALAAGRTPLVCLSPAFGGGVGGWFRTAS